MYESIVSALQCGRRGCACGRWRGDGNLHCPNKAAHAHGDADPGLTTTIKGDKILFDCKKGCASSTVLSVLHTMNLWPPPKDDPMPAAARRTNRPRKLVAEWPYKDASGATVALKARFDFTDAEGGKTYLWKRAGGNTYGGLAGMAMEDMPLYNLEGVLESPAETIYFVEGEKAADACIEHGLVAVSLGGGAGQTAFGRTLEPLRGRDVVLWPDNDDAGYALMTRLASELPKARFLRLPDWIESKGDAFDFFADSRGTVQLIADLIETREPRVRWEDDGETLAIDVYTAKGDVQFYFNDWTIRQNVVEPNVLTRVGGQQGDEYEVPARVNFRSMSQCEAYRRLLDNFFGKDWDWTKLTTRIFRLAENTYNAAEQSVDLAEIRPDYTSLWLVEDLIPEGQPTILFAAGGAGKTSVVMDLIVSICYEAVWLGHAANPPAAITYLDYESGPQSITRRYWRALEGHGRTPETGIFHYVKAKGRPLTSMVHTLKAQIKRTGSQLLIVDSAATACGGKPEDSDVALAMFRAIEQLKITTIIITHINRQGDKYQPFGSAFWHNEARATYYLEAVNRRHDRDDRRFIDLVMYPRKMNDDVLPKLIPLSIEFTGARGPIRVIDGADTTAGRVAEEPQTQAEAVRRALEDAEQEQLRPTVEWLVKHIEEQWPAVQISAQRVGNILRDFVRRRAVGVGRTASTGRAKVYWLLDDPEPGDDGTGQQAFEDNGDEEGLIE